VRASAAVSACSTGHLVLGGVAGAFLAVLAPAVLSPAIELPARDGAAVSTALRGGGRGGLRGADVENHHAVVAGVADIEQAVGGIVGEALRLIQSRLRCSDAVGGETGLAKDISGVLAVAVERASGRSPPVLQGAAPKAVLLTTPLPTSADSSSIPAAAGCSWATTATTAS